MRSKDIKQLTCSQLEKPLLQDITVLIILVFPTWLIMH